jgi:hypothetical protein
MATHPKRLLDHAYGFLDWDNMVQAEEVKVNCLPCQVNTESRSHDHPRNTKGKKHQHGFLGLQQQKVGGTFPFFWGVTLIRTHL